MKKNNKKASLEDLFFVLKRDIRENIRKEGFKHDLTFSQVEILSFIGPSGKETMKHIADYLKISPPSATETVAKLEKSGLVKRIGDKYDRRIVYIVPTETSKKLFVSICKRKDVIFKKLFSKLSEKDKKSLERIIKILITE